MMNDLEVLVIIPAFNAAATIGATLDSLLAQTHRMWKGIVVDDGSTDETAAIASTYAHDDARIRLVKRPNGGEAAARNSGLCEADAEWVLFLDADDWIGPTHLERLTAALAADRTLDAVHCRHARVAADGTQVVDTYQPPTGDLFPVLARRAAFPIHACLVRKRLVDEVGRFDATLKTSPDWDLWQRVARTGVRFGHVDEVLAFYRMSEGAASLDGEQLLRDGLRVLRQGHAADSRVPRPHPDHRDGAPPGGVLTQEFYLLAWCAGLLLGSGRDARSLLQQVANDRYPELYAPAVAQCLFEAASLPSRRTPQAWETLWPAIQERVCQFLAALEEHAQSADLATKTLTALKRLILGGSPLSAFLAEDLDAMRADIRELTALLESSRAAESELDELRATFGALEASHSSLEAEHAVLQEALQQEKDARRRSDAEQAVLQEALQQERATVEALEVSHGSLQTEHAVLQEAVRQERDARQRSEQIRRHLEETIDLAQQELRGFREENRRLEIERRSDEADRRERAVEMERLHQRLQALAHEHEQKRQQERAHLRGSPEWRVGHALWNTAGLNRVGGPAARGLRKLGDARNRLRLRFARSVNRLRAGRKPAVVAACWSFPIHSQTFVYQEIQSLGGAGLDPVVFCCETNPKSELPAAFAGLWPTRVELVPEWSINQRDFLYFQRTRPDRVRSLLERIGQATGLSLEALLRESIVMMGFTFARHVELAGAAYLHTYFFFDHVGHWRDLVIEQVASRITDGKRPPKVALYELDGQLVVDEEVVEAVNAMLRRHIMRIAPQPRCEVVRALAEKRSGIDDRAESGKGVLREVIAKLRFMRAEHALRVAAEFRSKIKPRASLHQLWLVHLVTPWSRGRGHRLPDAVVKQSFGDLHVEVRRCAAASRL